MNAARGWLPDGRFVDGWQPQKGLKQISRLSGKAQESSQRSFIQSLVWIGARKWAKNGNDILVWEQCECVLESCHLPLMEEMLLKLL